MILDAYYQTVEMFISKVKTMLNNELNKTFEWIYFHG